MKSFQLTLLSLLPLTAATAAFADDPVPQPLVAVHASDVFIPDGFDDNDETQVVLDGYLPDTCYRVSQVQTALNPTTGRIRVTQYARRFAGICLPTLVPFTSEARLGILPTGGYRVSSAGVADAPLRVSEATSAGPDDFLYAPIDAADVRLDADRGVYVATIRGRLTSNCMVWDRLQLLDQGKVKVLLPILQNVGAQTSCDGTAAAYEREIDLPSMTAGRYLLHVRSLNGKAVNSVFTVD